MKDPRKILCLDFDGVIHSYTSGWKGIDAIPDDPVPGAIDFIIEASKTFTVAIFSSRSETPEGRSAMRDWLFTHLTDRVGTAIGTEILLKLDFPKTKPPAFVGLDDRVLTFTGEWPLIEDLHKFKPWNK